MYDVRMNLGSSKVHVLQVKRQRNVYGNIINFSEVPVRKTRLP